MTDVVATGADRLVQYKGCSAGADQIARCGRQFNEAEYVVIADLVDGAGLGEVARSRLRYCAQKRDRLKRNLQRSFRLIYRRCEIGNKDGVSRPGRRRR